MILLIGSETDPHLRRIGQGLSRRGEPTRVLDLSRLGSTTLLTHDPDRPHDTLVQLGDTGSFRLSEARCIWLRRPSRPALPPEVPVGEDRLFARSEWRDLVSAMLLALSAPIVNDPTRQSLASNKPWQLSRAAHAGLTVPATLVTSSPQMARDFVDAGGPAIHKTLTSPTSRLLPTRRFALSDDALLDEHLPVAPTIFQREITDACDVRVTVAGPEIFTVRFDTRHLEHVDGRLDLDVARDMPRLPDAITESTQLLMSDLGLDFATLDFKEKDGDYVFLELNPQGQFLYVEILTGMPIVAAVADLLLSRARR